MRLISTARSASSFSSIFSVPCHLEIVTCRPDCGHLAQQSFTNETMTSSCDSSSTAQLLWQLVDSGIFDHNRIATTLHLWALGTPESLANWDQPPSQPLCRRGAQGRSGEEPSRCTPKQIETKQNRTPPKKLGTEAKPWMNKPVPKKKTGDEPPLKPNTLSTLTA